MAGIKKIFCVFYLKSNDSLSGCAKILKKKTASGTIELLRALQNLKNLFSLRIIQNEFYLKYHDLDTSSVHI